MILRIDPATSVKGLELLGEFMDFVLERMKERKRSDEDMENLLIELDAFMKAPNGKMALLAVEGGKPVGYLLGRFNLRGFFVSQMGFHGKVVAKQLIEETKRQGVKRVQALVHKGTRIWEYIGLEQVARYYEGRF